MSKISELSDGGSLLPTDFLIAVRSGGNVKVQADQTEFDRIRLGDGEKIELGNNQDLQIYHDGNNSYIKDTGTGDLLIEGSDNIWLLKAGGSEVFLNTADDGAVTLYHNGSPRIATTSGGADVTGSVTADGLTVDSGTSTPIVSLSRSGTHSGITFSQTVSNTTGAGADLINYSSNNDTGYVWQTTDSGGTQAKALLIAPNRDISFYEDTGTTAKLFWDASAESLGIGTSSPAMLLDLDASSASSNDIARFSGKNSAGLTFRNATSNEFIIHTATSDALVFGTNGNNERLRIDGTSGNVQARRARSNTAGEVALSLQPTDSTIHYGFRIDPSTNSFNLDRVDSAGQLLSVNTSGAATFSSSATFGGDITLSGASFPTLRITDTTNNCILDLRANDSDTLIRTTSNHPMILNTNQKDRIQIAANGDISFYEDTGTTAKLHWDAADESLLLGTTSPSSGVPLTAVYNSTSQFHFGGVQAGISNNTYYNGSAWVNRNSSVGGSILQMSTSGEFNFRRAGTGANPTLSYSMTIDGSGNLLVGKTASGTANTGAELRNGSSNHAVIATSTSETPLVVNRKTNDGLLINLLKDSGTIGSLASLSGDMLVGTGNTGLRFYDAGKAIQPRNTDGSTARGSDAISLGMSDDPFKDLYLSGGVYLGGTAAANKLDYFEQGTWSPVWTGTTTTISINSAVFTRVGDLVTVHAYISNISPSTGTSTQTITGLPFTVAAGTHYGTGIITYSGNADVAGIGMLAYPGHLYFHYIDGTSQNALSNANWNNIKSSGLSLIFSATYRAA